MNYELRIRKRVKKDLSLIAYRVPRNSGQSVIEVIVAVAIFVIIAGSSVVTILGSLSASRLGEEETQATQLAVEGIEAAQSIRNQGWDDPLLATDCTTAVSSCGLVSSGGTWAFSGTEDVNGKFTRKIWVDPVERDAIDDDIVSSGGTTDDDTRLVTSSVTWDFTSGRTNTVEVTEYVTNWQEGVGAGGPTATTTPTPTVTATPTPTDTPVNTCNDYCTGLGGYSAGTCRKKTSDCSANGEDYQSGGDQYCPGGAQKYCCCLP